MQVGRLLEAVFDGLRLSGLTRLCGIASNTAPCAGDGRVARTRAASPVGAVRFPMLAGVGDHANDGPTTEPQTADRRRASESALLPDARPTGADAEQEIFLCLPNAPISLRK
jgi:hypothetical protein